MFTSELYHQRRIISLRAVVTSAQAQLHRLRRWKIFVIDFNILTSYLYIFHRRKNVVPHRRSQRQQHDIRWKLSNSIFNLTDISSRFGEIPSLQFTVYWIIEKQDVFSFPILSLSFSHRIQREIHFFFKEISKVSSFLVVAFTQNPALCHGSETRANFGDDSLLLFERCTQNMALGSFLPFIKHAGFVLSWQRQVAMWYRWRKKLLEANVVNEIETLPTSGLNY